MFVGNTTLIRTVNDTLSTNSSSSSSSQYSSKRLSTFCPISSQVNEEYLPYTPTTDENNHYDEIDFQEKNEQIQKEEVIQISISFLFNRNSFIQTCDDNHDDTRSSSYSSSFAAGLNSDEISSAVSNDYCQTEEEEEEEKVENESIYELNLIVDQVRTCLDDLRLIDRSFSIIFDKIEQILNDLDKIIQIQIDEQTEKTLEIENILEDFQFLNTFDDEDTSKTIDSGFEGEQQTKQNQNINQIFVDILNRILILLHVKIHFCFFIFSFFINQYIQNRSKSDDNLPLERLNDQYEQLNIAISWNQNQIKDVKQGK